MWGNPERTASIATIVTPVPPPSPLPAAHQRPHPASQMRITVLLACAVRDGWVSASAEVAARRGARTPAENEIDGAVRGLQQTALLALDPAERVCVACRAPLGQLPSGGHAEWACATVALPEEVGGGNEISYAWPACSGKPGCEKRAAELARVFERLVVRCMFEGMPPQKVFSVQFGVYPRVAGEEWVDRTVGDLGPDRTMDLSVDKLAEGEMDRAAATRMAFDAARTAVEDEVIRRRPRNCITCGHPAARILAAPSWLRPWGGRFCDFELYAAPTCMAGKCRERALGWVRGRLEFLPSGEKRAGARLPLAETRSAGPVRRAPGQHRGRARGA